MSDVARNRGKAVLLRATSKAEKQRWERLAKLERRPLVQLLRVLLQERLDEREKMAVGQ
jgi:hypothetical protein